MTPAELHKFYCELTGLQVRLNFYVESSWSRFVEMGFTGDDLRVVIAFTRRKIARGENGYNQQSLLFRVLADDDWTKFDERLQLARQERGRKGSAGVPPAASQHRQDAGAPVDAGAPMSDEQRLAAKRDLEKFRRELGGQP
jgi:hypothetical protein